MIQQLPFQNQYPLNTIPNSHSILQPQSTFNFNSQNMFNQQIQPLKTTNSTIQQQQQQSPQSPSTQLTTPQIQGQGIMNGNNSVLPIKSSDSYNNQQWNNIIPVNTATPSVNFNTQSRQEFNSYIHLNPQTNNNNNVVMKNNQHYPMSIMNQQQNLNNYQNNYLNNGNQQQDNHQQQSIIQLQAMNMKYQQIIQQQQEQLNNMQFNQYKQVASQTTTGNSFNLPIHNNNQIQCQGLNLPFNPLSSVPHTILPDITLNPYQMNTVKPNYINQYPQQLPNLQQNHLMDLSQPKLNLSGEMNKMNTIQQSQIQQQQQQLQQNQLIQLNQQSELLLGINRVGSQSFSHSNGDTQSQSQINPLETSQYSFSTFKTNEKIYSQDKIMGQLLNSSNYPSFQNNNTKIDDQSQYHEQIQTINSQIPLSQQNTNNSLLINNNQNKTECLSYNKNSPTRQLKDDSQEIIHKKRFVEVKMEDEHQQQLMKGNNTEVKAINIPSLTQFKDIPSPNKQNSFDCSQNQSTATTLNASALIDQSQQQQQQQQQSNQQQQQQQQSSLSSQILSLLDQDEQQFPGMSSFENIQESQSIFDKLLKKLSINELIQVVLQNFPSKPEESTNFEKKFVNSMKAKQSKDKRNPNALYMTRFHNLTRLLMYNIVQLFCLETLSQNLNVNIYIAQELDNICRKIKKHARQTCNGQFKTDFYTHSHYNGLFLLIDNSTLSHLQKSTKDIEIHESVYSLDLTSLTSSTLQTDFAVKKCNFFKILAFEILMRCSSYTLETKNICEDDSRRIYFRRALSGISKLNKGQVVHRF